MSHIDKVISQSASVSTTQAYETVQVDLADAVGVQVNVSSSSTPSIEFKLQASIDGTNFIDLPGSIISITADGNHLIEIGTLTYKYLRAYLTRTSGSATVGVEFAIKDIPV